MFITCFFNSETGPPVDNAVTNVDIALIFLIFHAFALNKRKVFLVKPNKFSNLVNSKITRIILQTYTNQLFKEIVHYEIQSHPS